MKKCTLTLLHLERPKLYTILAILSAVGLRYVQTEKALISLYVYTFFHMSSTTLWMDGWHAILSPFQQYFSHIRVMKGW